MITYSYFAVFLSGSDLESYQNYLKAYEAGKAKDTNGVPMRISGIDIDQLIGNEQEPPFIPRGGGRAEFPSQVKSFLDESEKIGLSYYQDKFAKLPDEKVVDSWITALSEDWEGYAKGTLVYLRKTNLGTIAFGFPHAIIDLKTGIIHNIFPSPEDLHPKPEITLWAEKSGSVNLLNIALIFASYLSFELGPGGAVLSGIFQIFNMLFGGTSKLPQMISDALRIEFLKHDLSEASTTFETDYNWFMSYNQGQIIAGDPNYEQFHKDLAQKLRGDYKGTLWWTNQLTTPDYLVPAFPLFLVMANFVMTLMKLNILYQSTSARVKDVQAYKLLGEYLEKYIEKANEAIDTIDKKVQDRLDQVTDIYEKTDQRCGGSDLAPHCQYYHYWEYEDKNTHQKYTFYDTQEQVGSSKCKSQTVQHKDEASQSREKYLAKLKDDQIEKYYKGPKEDVTYIINKWKQAQRIFPPPDSSQSS